MYVNAKYTTHSSNKKGDKKESMEEATRSGGDADLLFSV